MLMNLGDLNSLIDTEAVPSVLDQHIAHKLHLTGSTEKLSVFTHKVDTEQAVVLKVQVGPLRAEALPVVVRDLSFAEDASGIRDAELGFWLRWHSCRLLHCFQAFPAYFTDM